MAAPSVSTFAPPELKYIHLNEAGERESFELTDILRPCEEDPPVDFAAISKIFEPENQKNGFVISHPGLSIMMSPEWTHLFVKDDGDLTFEDDSSTSVEKAFLQHLQSRMDECRSARQEIEAGNGCGLAWEDIFAWPANLDNLRHPSATTWAGGITEVTDQSPSLRTHFTIALLARKTIASIPGLGATEEDTLPATLTPEQECLILNHLSLKEYACALLIHVWNVLQSPEAEAEVRARPECRNIVSYLDAFKGTRLITGEAPPPLSEDSGSSTPYEVEEAPEPVVSLPVCEVQGKEDPDPVDAA